DRVHGGAGRQRGDEVARHLAEPVVERRQRFGGQEAVEGPAPGGMRVAAMPLGTCRWRETALEKRAWSRAAWTTRSCRSSTHSPRTLRTTPWRGRSWSAKARRSRPSADRSSGMWSVMWLPRRGTASGFHEHSNAGGARARVDPPSRDRAAPAATWHVRRCRAARLRRANGPFDAGRRAPVHASMSAAVRWSRRMAGPDITLYLVHLDIDVAGHPDPAPDLVEL